MEQFPMSNISAKFAFALLVVFASLAASFARHGGLAATRNIDSSEAGKCFQGSRATAAEVTGANFVHPGGFGGPPKTNTEGRGVKGPGGGAATYQKKKKNPAGVNRRALDTCPPHAVATLEL